MLSERIDSINENKTFFFLENNDIFGYNGNEFQSLNKINTNLIVLDEDQDLLKNKNLTPYYFANKKEENININKGISTELSLKEKQNMYNRFAFLHKIVENNEGNVPFLFSFENILNIFKKEDNKNKFDNILKHYNNKEKIKKDTLLLDKKRKRTISEDENSDTYELIEKEKQNENKSENEKEKNNIHKRGRKTNEIKDIGVHNKMVPDNIIKKIKAKIFEYSIIFLNNILNKNKSGDKLYKLDYQFINRLNREEDLKFLNMKLKDLFSKEISPKYITKERQKDWNKRFIERILKNQSDNTILFVFNIDFRDWLDLFTLKKNINDIIIKYDYLDKDIDCERIQKSLFGVDKFLNKIMSQNDKEYLTMFIFLLYNYERWFYNKIGRKARIKRK